MHEYGMTWCCYSRNVATSGFVKSHRIEPRCQGAASRKCSFFHGAIHSVLVDRTMWYKVREEHRCIIISYSLPVSNPLAASDSFKLHENALLHCSYIWSQSWIASFWRFRFTDKTREKWIVRNRRPWSLVQFHESFRERRWPSICVQHFDRQ